MIRLRDFIPGSSRIKSTTGYLLQLWGHSFANDESGRDRPVTSHNMCEVYSISFIYDDGLNLFS